jgi:thiol-disulfide isomerase/thioredoxin
MSQDAKKQISTEKHAKKILIATWILIAIAAVVGGFLYVKSIPPPKGEYDAFAKCIANTSTTFYGASWCPHCHDQKAEFGTAAQYLPYVECSYAQGTQLQVCTDKGITNYPTWYFPDGSSSTGEQTLALLAQKTGCALPTSTQ